MKRLAAAVTILLATLGVPVAGHADDALRPAEYTAQVVQDQPITMSDGVKLYSDWIVPVGSDGQLHLNDHRFPVVLTQTPYNKATPLNFRSDSLVTHGYLQVIVDVRGTGSSEGVWDSFGTREQLDGAELANWAHTAPFGNGDVLLHGTSYGAINQFLTAAQHPAGLKAMFPIVPMADAYRDITASGGEVNTSFIPSWLGLVTALGLIPPTYSATDPVEAATVLAQHAGGAVTFQGTTVPRAMFGGDNSFDGPFYRTRSPIEVVDKVDVPTFIAGGWFDLFQRGEPMLYNHLKANNVPTHLIMGPWYHVTAGNGLPVDNVKALDELELRWFDKWTRSSAPQGAADPVIDAMSSITYYRIGDGHYHGASSFPPADVTFAPKLLSTGALGDTSGGAPDTLVWQPGSGVCTRSTAQWTAAGVNAGCETDMRVNDQTGLVYDMPVGSTPLDITGPIAVHLYASTNGKDAFLTTRIADVDASGASTQLTAGWNLLSQRALDQAKTVMAGEWVTQPYHPFSRESLQIPGNGEIVDVWVEIFPTAAMIAPGHTLRLSIQPSDAPHLTGTIPAIANLAGGVLTLYHDADHPSAVVLPFGG